MKVKIYSAICVPIYYLKKTQHVIKSVLPLLDRNKSAI